MEIVLVTGGNKGIGLEICRKLDELGYQVILGSRDYEKGNEATKSLSVNTIAKQLDVTSEESIQTLFSWVNTNFGKLDVLINNAGIAGDKGHVTGVLGSVKSILEKRIPGVKQMNQFALRSLRKTGMVAQRQGAKDVSLSDVKQIMETNLFGVWRMIQVFIPLLVKSTDGRIINVSSGQGELTNLSGDYPGYSLSKSALNALTIMFSNELAGIGISVNAMCPGWVKTDMGGPNAPRLVSQGADTAVWLTTEKGIPTGKFFRDRKEICW